MATDLRATRFLIIAVPALLASVVGAEIVGTFENERYGYTTQYPTSWHRQELPDQLWLENFPPSKAIRGAYLPKDGAVIKMFVPSQITRHDHRQPEPLEEWAMVGFYNRKVVSRRRFEAVKGKDAFPVIETITQCCGDRPDEEVTNWYFQIGGRYFLASLIYRPGNQDLGSLRETLKSIVLSVRTKP